MFTIQDLERAKQEKYGIQDSILFSLERNHFAYAMSCENSTDRGDYAEFLMCDRLQKMGYTVQRLGGANNSYDLILNKSIRAEVKLATLRRRNVYICEKIKPELFDVLIMMFLTPDGMVIRWTTAEDFRDWASWHKRGKEGYSLYFNNYLENHNIRYSEFDTFLDYYNPRYIKYLAS
jgi:hypothetical protein